MLYFLYRQYSNIKRHMILQKSLYINVENLNSNEQHLFQRDWSVFPVTFEQMN